VLIRSYEPLEIVSLPVPDDLFVAVVHPHCEVSTSDARRLVQARTFGLEAIVANLGNVASLVAALHKGDLDLLGRSIEDRLIEPLRATLIPGFAAVKSAAFSSGALGCSIAGSGPSVFAFGRGPAAAESIGDAMRSAFRSAAQLGSDLYVGNVNRRGTRIL
jgi:homoserine kinase